MKNELINIKNLNKSKVKRKVNKVSEIKKILGLRKKNLIYF